MSAKLSHIAAIRAVIGDGHSDDALRVLLAKHGDNVESVVNELLEELIGDFQAEEEQMHWQCPTCTLENRMTESVCTACEQPRSSHQEQQAAAAVSGGGGVAASPRIVLPPRAPETLEDFLSSTSFSGEVRMVMHLELPGGGTIQVTRALPAAQMRRRIALLAETPPPQPPQTPPQTPPSEQPAPPSQHGPPPPPQPPPPPAVSAAGGIVGGKDRFSVPSANQGAFGGERSPQQQQQQGLPQPASRKGRQPRGPPQKGLQERLSLDEVRSQLGDGAIRQAIEQAIERGGADDGNARVNADVRADAPLYDDGVGGAFERSVFVDPARSSRGGAPQARSAQEQLASIRPPPPGSLGPSDNLPVAYEVAAVGSRLRNMARVAGQRVLEMDHFVESVSTPIVRLVLPGQAQPGSSREAVIAARKVLERKLLRRDAHAPVLALGGDAPPLRVLTALGDDGDEGGSGGGGACCARACGGRGPTVHADAPLGPPCAQLPVRAGPRFVPTRRALSPRSRPGRPRAADERGARAGGRGAGCNRGRASRGVSRLGAAAACGSCSASLLAASSGRSALASTTTSSARASRWASVATRCWLRSWSGVRASRSDRSATGGP